MPSLLESNGSDKPFCDFGDASNGGVDFFGGCADDDDDDDEIGGGYADFGGIDGDFVGGYAENASAAAATAPVGLGALQLIDEGRKVLVEEIDYARVAKRVDIRGLKEGLWTTFTDEDVECRNDYP